MIAFPLLFKVDLYALANNLDDAIGDCIGYGNHPKILLTNQHIRDPFYSIQWLWFAINY